MHAGPSRPASGTGRAGHRADPAHICRTRVAACLLPCPSSTQATVATVGRAHCEHCELMAPASLPPPPLCGGLQAIAAGVDHDLQLIAERVRRLTGAQGTARLEAALTAARATAAAEHREAAAASGSEGDVGQSLPAGSSLARWGRGAAGPAPILSPSRCACIEFRKFPAAALLLAPPTPPPHTHTPALQVAQPVAHQEDAAQLWPLPGRQQQRGRGWRGCSDDPRTLCWAPFKVARCARAA